MPGSTPPPLTFHDRVKHRYPTLSPAQTAVANYVLNDPEAAVFLTAEEVARAIKVSPSSVVRFALSLGYRGYAELQAELRSRVRATLRPAERLDQPLPNDSDIALRSLQQDADAIARLLSTMRTDQLHHAATLLLQSKAVYIKASRTSQPIGRFLALVLAHIRPQVTLLGTPDDTLTLQLTDLKADDLLVAISLPRYTRSTVSISEFFSSRQVPIIAISDSVRAPIARIATIFFEVPYASPSFFNSNVAALALINALLASATIRSSETTRARLEITEAISEAFGVHTSNTQRGP